MVQYCFDFDLMVRTSLKLLVCKANLRNKVGTDFSKNSNERKLSYSTYHCYFLILLKSIAIYPIKRNGRYMFYQKDCWHWQKIQVNWTDYNSFHSKKIKKKYSKVFFIKFKRDSFVSQVGKLFLTRKFSNRTIFLVVLVFNQIHNKFRFHEAFYQNSFKILIEKIKILTVRVPNSKRTALLLTSTFTKKIILSRTFLLFYS